MEALPSRRDFLSGVGAAVGASALVVPVPACRAAPVRPRSRERVVVSTWPFGRAANDVAWAHLQGGCDHPLDACEAGVRVTEADPTVASVGLGGRPNAEGLVELDSAIMRGDTLACGAVGALPHVMHPVSVARKVMEETPHVLLVGAGALAFARARGFPEQDLLTDSSRQAFEAWRATHRSGEGDADHDTIGMIAMDRGRFATAVTTSGLAFKLPGRVGDSPLVGAGGYCDDEAGAAVSTGVGEEVIRTCGSFAVVERMRGGASPREACLSVLDRIRRSLGRRGAGLDVQVAFLAMDPSGSVGGAALKAGFTFARTDAGGTRLVHGEVLA